MAQEQPQLPHKLCLNERKNLTMTGVTEVISFDDTIVVLRTGLGVLTVEGQQLQLRNLSQDGGQLAVDGRISALQYQEPRASGNLWHRLFG